jgi:ABC-type uncharacterized transport system permease subunit
MVICEVSLLCFVFRCAILSSVRKCRNFSLNRLLLVLALVRALFIVWWTLDVTLLELALLTLFGVAVTVAADYSLRQIETISQPLARALAFIIVLLAFSDPSPVLLLGIIVPGALVGSAATISWPLCLKAVPQIRHNYLNRQRFPILSPGELYTARHGAHRLHPVTQTLLYYSPSF